MAHTTSLNRVGDTYRGFRVTHQKEISELQCTLRELVHEATGAHILHIGNDDPENTFCLSFRTTPTTSNGVAHILEHTVLCGSEKYPVKDPFFAMTRRSLNTFMNAMTGADFTCYPAASQVPKDFYNLLEVYLDAVFEPKLKELSFRQEGHRLEFSEPQDPKTALQYKGIVYNEMKGAMASPGSRLDDCISSALFPDLTYGINSGGDPKVIPELTYEEFKAFHSEYYNPSRCLFYFYGNLPLEGHLDFIADKTLDDAQKLPPLTPIPRQKRYTEPVRRESTYPAGPDVDEAEKAYFSVSWLTSHILDLDEVLALDIIDSALMDTDASPLRHALLQSGLCKQASSSMEDEISEVPYTLILRGCDPANAEKLEQLVFTELRRIADEGISQKLIESALHQMELGRSEITGDSSPFGLSLFWRSALLKQHGGAPEHGLVIHSLFERLRGLIENDPRYFSRLIEKQLLNNPHRVVVLMTPDRDLTKKEEEQEKARLAAIQEKLSAAQVQKLMTDAKALSEFQKQQEAQDLDCLPKLTLADVPKEVRDYPLIKETHGNLSVYRHCCFTNSILYADIVFDLPAISESELPYIRLFGNLLSQVGCGGRDYRQTLEFMHENTGGVGASLHLNPQITDPRHCIPSITIKGKSLYRKADKLFSLMHDVIASADFSDTARVKEVLLKHYTGLEAAFNSHAMRYALGLSACGLDIPSRINYAWFGLEYFYTIRDIVKNLSTRLPELINRLNDLKERLLDLQHPDLVVACDEEFYQQMASQDFYGITGLGKKVAAPWQSGYSIPVMDSRGYVISSPVAFTGKTFITPSYLHPAAPALSLAGNVLENTILHQKIREEGGAYGSGAGHNTAYGHFYFYSYRDPNIAETLKAFEESVEEIVKGEFSDEDLAEAKLEMIQDSDAPVAPGSRAGLAYGWLRCGKTREMRQDFRNRLLATTKEQVCDAARQHLLPSVKAAPAVAFAGRELIEKENLVLEKESRPLLSVTTV
ncbi:MAG: insulinase family protein [Chlamydiales bacterium]|nr:insulinase family protein [Chlamydiales bacterium]